MILRSKIVKRNQKRIAKRNSFFLNLSDEVMIKIFFFLNDHDLLNNIPLVCKRWNRLSQDPSYWKSKSLNYRRIKNRRWRNILSKCRFIKELTIEYCKITQRSPLNYLKNLRHLQHLILQHCHFTEIEKRIFEPLLNKSIPCIMHLTFMFCTNTNEFLKQITDLKTLKCLVLLNYDTISREAFNNVLENCTKMIHVRLIQLNEDFGDFKNEAINSIFRIRSDTLEQVALHVDCNDDSFTNLDDCLNLESLIISNCSKVGDNTLFLIKKLRVLKNLSLALCSNFTSAGIAELFSEENLSNLTSLILWECPGLSDSNLNLITNCSKLLLFRLVYCTNVSDEGVSKIVKKCSSLVKLEIRKCALITGQFLKTLSTDLKNLKELCLDEELEENEDIISLKRKRPSVKFKFLPEYNFPVHVISSLLNYIVN